MALEYRADIFLPDHHDDEEFQCGDCQTLFQPGELRLSAGIQIDSGERFENWFHFKCFFKLHRPLSTDEITHFEHLPVAEQQKIKSKIAELCDSSQLIVNSISSSSFQPSRRNRNLAMSTPRDPKLLEDLIQSQTEYYQKIRQLLEVFADNKILSEFLKANKSRVPWNYEKVLDRCADLIAFGALQKCDKCDGGDLFWRKFGYRCDGIRNQCDNSLEFPQRFPVEFPESMIIFQSELISNNIALSVQDRAFRSEDQLVEPEPIVTAVKHPKGLPEATRNLMKLIHNLEHNYQNANYNYRNYRYPSQHNQVGVNDKSVDELYKQMTTKLELLDHNSREFHLIQSYMTNTHAYLQCGYVLIVEDVFKVERQGEKDRYQRFKSLHNRQLLWHGSSTTNFASILEKGLKIAPPEAPMTGQMFGKGIYFADMVTKSSNYCRVQPNTNPIGLMMLSEVALGNTMDLVNAQAMSFNNLGPNYHSVRGLGKSYPDPGMSHTTEDGVIIPLGIPITDNNRMVGLNYNEYIVYDVSQVNMKYLVKMKFKFR